MTMKTTNDNRQNMNRPSNEGHWGYVRAIAKAAQADINATMRSLERSQELVSTGTTKLSKPAQVMLQRLADIAEKNAANFKGAN